MMMKKTTKTTATAMNSTIKASRKSGIPFLVLAFIYHAFHGLSILDVASSFVLRSQPSGYPPPKRQPSSSLVDPANINQKIISPPLDVARRQISRRPQQRITTQPNRPSYQQSALFGSSSLSSSSKRRLPISFEQITNAIQRNKKIWLVPVLAILVLPRWVGRLSVSSLNFVLETLPWKPIARVFLVVWILVSILSTIHTNRRQAKDATSEWQRFSQRPGARGRAILWLLVKQAFFILAARITSLFGADATRIRRKAGRAFSNGLLKLGPLYIKLGQIVSCRPGLLGKEWIDAMADLQDRVPARAGQDALDLAYSSLAGGKEEFDRLFVDFDSTPLAAASLGQVHRARLRQSGAEIAVKVQRPYLRQIYDQDFVLLTTVAQWMDKLPSSSKNVGGVESSWTQIFVDAEDILYREIDYRAEADNAVRFAEEFGLGLGGNATTPTAFARNNRTLPSAAEWLRTPYVYADVSNERLLVMEYVPSIKITNRAKLDAANITEEDRAELADSLARAYLRQFCSHLFFSTDPHPGNLGVEIFRAPNKPLEIGPTGTRHENKFRLVMYDFGQAASLTRGQGDGILDIIEAIIDTDVDRSIEAFQKMGVLVDGADLDQVRAKVAENYRTGKVKANRKKLRRKGYKFHDDTDSASKMRIIESSSVGNDSQVMSYFSLPAEYAFVARAISQMDGVGKSLDPEFDFISSGAPYLVEIKGADLYLKDEALKFYRGIQSRVTKFQMVTIPRWWEDRTKV